MRKLILFLAAVSLVLFAEKALCYETTFSIEPESFNSFRYEEMRAEEAAPLSIRTGRFLSVDPKTGYEPRKLPQGWNRYAYAMNNPVKFIDPDGEETRLAVGGRTNQNPVGHLAIIVNDKVYSYGTNWSNRGANQQDWGASSQVYLDAQSGHRQTQLMTLNITPEQEQKLQQHLDANNPNAPGAPKYNEIANSCVTVTYNALTQTGTLPNVPIQQPSGMLVMSHVGAILPAEAANNVQQTGIVRNTQTVGTEPKVGFWRSVWNAVTERF